MLRLEADLYDARTAVRSLLSDLGVESGLWTLPNIDRVDTLADNAEDALAERADALCDKCFPNSMPLGDFDHMLHLAMTEAEVGFASAAQDDWAQFDRQINGIAKFFSKRDCAELYVQLHIQNNSKIPAQAKRSLSSMFETLCPTFIKTRWHYGFDVLHWISRRQALLLA